MTMTKFLVAMSSTSLKASFDQREWIMLVQKVPSRMLDLELHLEFLASSAKIESLGKAQCGEDESLAHLLCIQETKWEH